MISNIQPKELINTDQFVREPVDNICKAINKDTSNKIILNGSRGSGKSTVLYNLENRGLGTENQSIYMCFDSCKLFSESNKFFNQEFKKQYYELVLSFNLLSYVSKNYSLIYEKHFKDIYIELKDISKKIDNQIKIANFEEIKFKNMIVPFEISTKIINKIVKYLDINNLNLCIDRFDWTNGNNEIVQQILSEYFDMFDKVIITTDDETLKNSKNIELNKKGYSFITIDYGKYKNIIKEIIKKRIKFYNQKNGRNSIFQEQLITDKIYKDLIEKTDGNISLLLDIIREVADLCEWEEKTENLENLFNTQSENQLEQIKQFRKISKTPRLYL